MLLRCLARGRIRKQGAPLFFLCDFDSAAASHSSSLHNLEVKVSTGSGKDRGRRRTRAEGRRQRLAGE